jgi:hypothetical protein
MIRARRRAFWQTRLRAVIHNLLAASGANMWYAYYQFHVKIAASAQTRSNLTLLAERNVLWFALENRREGESASAATQRQRMLQQHRPYLGIPVT